MPDIKDLYARSLRLLPEFTPNQADYKIGMAVNSFLPEADSRGLQK